MHAAPPAPTQELGPYVLDKPLGCGAFARVKLATHRPTGLQVAVKAINRRRMAELGVTDKVHKEIHNFCKLQHPHVLRLHQVISTPRDVFLVMEYAPHGDLFMHIVQNTKFPEAEARRLFQQIICGVDYCHSQGVVHRDLKPENLLLDERHRIKLADFGLSNQMVDGYFLRTSCGSPNYAAPEVIAGHAYAGPEVDIWSCGVILYALLLGNLPFEDEHENQQNLFRKIMAGRYKLPTRLSQPSRDLISKMLVVDPLRRITIRQIRAHPWFAVDLPAYLHDPKIVEAAVSFDLRVAQQVMAVSAPTLTLDAVKEESSCATAPSSPVAVTYDILARHALLSRVDSICSSSGSSITSPSSAEDVDMERGVPESPAAGGTRGTPLFASLLPPVVPVYPQGAASPWLTLPTAQRRKRRWYCGLHSQYDPMVVMAALFHSLQTFGFAWKVLAPYRIRCSWRGADKTQPPVLKMGIQVYKQPTGLLLIDVHKILGDPYSFMQITGQITYDLGQRGLLCAPLSRSSSPTDMDMS